jgi:hypothetical protein
MPRSDVCTISALFLGVGMTLLILPSTAWGLSFLAIGAMGMVLYVCMGRFKTIIHYAGWGQGPESPFLLTVTKTMQAYVDAHRRDVKASSNFFGEHYVSPRILVIEYSRGRWGEQHRRVFVEHEIVRLD